MKLYVVGIGAGNEDGITIAAKRMLEKADIIVGYKTYVELVKAFLPDKEYYASAMRQEKERCEEAIRLTLGGKKTAVVCSGDAGVYGMASLLYEMTKNLSEIDVCVVAGVSSVLSGAALVGAPVANDFAVISLSDLLTPMDQIEKRLRAAAEGDFVICLYNPSSKKRSGYLRKACEIVMEYRDTKTVCAAAKNIGRAGEEYSIMTLTELREYEADMFTTVFIGSSVTKNINGKMVTPRGYKNV